MADRLLRNAINSVIPNWLANRPRLNTGFKVLYAIALVGDTLIENGWQGLLATFPGVGTDTALPLIAQTRGLLQGPHEPNASFVTRLLAWLDTWANAASDEVLVQQLQAFMTPATGPLPTVRLVNRRGNWVIVNPDKTITLASGAWNWDGTSGFDDGAVHPASVVPGYWSDLWLVVYPDPFARYTSLTDPAWLAAWGRHASVGLGHQVPRVYVDGIHNLVSTWKGAHTWLRAIVWSSDPAKFIPTSPTADGTYGNLSNSIAGVQTPARDPSARYWTPAGGA
ncbi:MAG: hypothetical protein M3O50_05305 [Myxococcota bacterium]|nr:hypothetical protein [Myxococcota bacterium]